MPLEFIANDKIKNPNEKDSDLIHAHLNTGDAIQAWKCGQQEYCLSVSLFMDMQN